MMGALGIPRDSKQGNRGTLEIPGESKKVTIGTLGLPRDSQKGHISEIVISTNLYAEATRSTFSEVVRTTGLALGPQRRSHGRDLLRQLSGHVFVLGQPLLSQNTLC